MSAGISAQVREYAEALHASRVAFVQWKEAKTNTGKVDAIRAFRSALAQYVMATARRECRGEAVAADLDEMAKLAERVARDAKKRGVPWIG